MNRIVATMSILVDAGVCTHRQNLLLTTRGARENDGQFHDWREEFYKRLARFHAQSPKSRVMPGCAAEYRVTSSDTDWRAASRAKWPIKAHLEGIVSNRKRRPTAQASTGTDTRSRRRLGVPRTRTPTPMLDAGGAGSFAAVQQGKHVLESIRLPSQDGHVLARG
jgi:hypothetical protein